MYDDLIAAVDRLFPSIRDDHTSLVQIPSVSAEGYDPARVRESAETIADLYRHAGFPEVRLLEIEGAHPAVFAGRAPKSPTPSPPSPGRTPRDDSISGAAEGKRSSSPSPVIDRAV